MKFIGYALLFLATIAGTVLITYWATIQARRIEHNQSFVEQQALLEDLSDRSTIIDTKLREVLASIPSAARGRVSMLHQMLDNGANITRFDVTNVAIAPNHEIDPMVTNAPITLWNDWMPTLLAGKCYFNYTRNLPDIDTRDRLGSRDIRAFVVCPIAGVYTQRLKGAVFISWDDAESVPTDFSDVMSKVSSLATFIANIQSSRTPKSTP